MLAHRIDDSNRTKDVILVENVTFESLLLSENVFKGLTQNGFKKPSPVQLKAIPVGRCGFDLIVKSKSGTGKTLVFSIIALESLKNKSNKLEVLILSPTREIAVQSQEVIKLIGCYFEGLNVESFIGGLSVDEDKEKCKHCHIAVGTPGRIKHLIIEGVLKTHSIRLFVLDEADKLMEQSFRNDINEIYNSLPAKKQIITTSATYPNQLEDFLSKYMLSPTHITAELDSPLLLGLRQFVVITNACSTVIQLMKLKTQELLEIIKNTSFTQCLIFTNYQTRAESLSNILNQKGWPATYISAAQTQVQRLAAMNELKDFKCRIMLSTDLTARGIDAANVDLVINYDIPNDPMTYLHRMGRAGRYGSTGVCINIASEAADLVTLQEILGSIGGTSLSVPKLPKFNGSIAELSKIQVPQEEHVFAIVKTDQEQKVDRNKIFETIETVKDENMEIIKNLNDSTSEIQIKKELPEMESTEMFTSLKQSKNETEDIKKQISGMDTESILNSLLNQSFKIEFDDETNENKNKIIQEFDMNAVMKVLTDDRQKNVSKPQALPSKPKINDEDVQDKKKEHLFTKNNALLGLSKILSGTSASQDTAPIETHLHLLKTEDKNKIKELSKKTTSDILNLLSQNDIKDEKNEEEEAFHSNTDEDSTSCDKINKDVSSSKNVEEQEPFGMENIFQFGYKNLVKSDDESWKDIFATIDKPEVGTSEDEVVADYEGIEEVEVETMKWVPVKEKTQGVKKKKQISESYSDVLDKENKIRKDQRLLSEDSEENMETNVKENKSVKKKQVSSGSSEDTTQNIMKWVRVDKKTNNQVKSTCVVESHCNEDHEEFNQYFDECSNSLWNTGLSFTNVDNFDDWFYYEWEAQLSAVRNYVQQNIYVSEMSSYQSARYNS